MEEKEFKILIKDIEKKYGEGSVMSLNNKDTHKNIDSISTGSLLVDEIIGIGGYPKGRIIEIYGPESSGKTTMALLAISSAQKEGGLCAFIDAEHSIDINHAENMGVDLSNILISQPDSGEHALQLVDYLCETKKFAMIVVDSVAALVPQAELDGKMQDQTIGAQARLMSKSMRKLVGSINKTNTIVIFINQIREKVGVIFGNPEVTPGGRALKFFASIRLDIRMKERIKEGEELVGQRINVKVVKNKMSPPYKETQTIIYYKNGIDKIWELIDLAVKKGVIVKSGSWFSYDEKKLGQGKSESAKYIKNHKLFKEIFNKTINKNIN